MAHGQMGDRRNANTGTCTHQRVADKANGADLAGVMSTRSSQSPSLSNLCLETGWVGLIVGGAIAISPAGIDTVPPPHGQFSLQRCGGLGDHTLCISRSIDATVSEMNQGATNRPPLKRGELSDVGVRRRGESVDGRGRGRGAKGRCNQPMSSNTARVDMMAGEGELRLLLRRRDLVILGRVRMASAVEKVARERSCSEVGQTLGRGGGRGQREIRRGGKWDFAVLLTVFALGSDGKLVPYLL